MSTLHTASRGEDGVEKSRGGKENGDISILRKIGFEKEFDTPIDPIKFDEYRKNRSSHLQSIRDIMSEAQRADPEWGGLTEGDIHTGVSLEDMDEYVAQAGKSLVLLRNRTLSESISLSPQIKADPVSLEKLRIVLSQYDENSLKNLIQRKSQLRKLIQSTFAGVTLLSEAERYDFEKIFHNRETYLDDEGKTIFERAYKEYRKFGSAPSKSAIEKMLDYYKNAPTKRKRELLVGLGVFLSLKGASDLGLIDEAVLENFASSEFGALYAELSREKQQRFLRSLRYTETEMLSADSFTEQGLKEIFEDERRKTRLVQAISKSINEALPLGEKQDGILGEIARRKKAENDLTNKNSPERIEEEEYDIYEAFVDELSQKMDGARAIKNIGKLKGKDAVVVFEDPLYPGSRLYFQIRKVRDERGGPYEFEREAKNGLGEEEYGLEIESYRVTEGKIVKSEVANFTYDEFLENVLLKMKNISVLSSEEFRSMQVDNPEKASIDGTSIYDAREDIDAEPINESNIAAKIDLIDDVGRGFGFGAGTAFIAPSTEEETGKKQTQDIWKIEKIYGEKVDLMDSTGRVLEVDFSLEALYEVLKANGTFQRIARIPDDKAFLSELEQYGELDKNAYIEDGKLMTQEEEGGKKTERHITCFKGEKGGHIRLKSIKNGVVEFGEYDDGGNEDTVIKAHAKKHGADSTILGLYEWRKMSYPAFIQYIHKQKLKASTKDLIVPNAGHDIHDDHKHHEHSHMEGSLWKKILRFQNPASIMKGIEMLWHGIEHTLEKGAKLDAARFAMSTSRFLGLPDSVDAQVYADITTASKEIIEKYEQKIFGLPGPAQRWKCIHIAHNRDSRPEEVMSAISFMMKSYGHLYAEDIKHYQSKVNAHNIATADPGYFAFFDALVITSKLGDLKYWRKKAYDRAIIEMGSEESHENEPSEEQLIHAMAKTIDGNWKDYPYAASVIRAIGGPGGFEKIWKFEGFDSAYKKGKDQSQMVNGRGRLNKAISYMGTHEIYKAIGAMEAVAAKGKEPELQSMPFIWACGGFSRYASHTALQKLKGYAENGFSFHAYSFLRNQESNEVYRKTVRLALEQMPGGGKGLADRFDQLCADLEFDNNKPEKTKTAAKKLDQFWQTYYHQGLHDMLQGQNGWLIKMARDGNSTVKEYNTIFMRGHGMLLKDSAIPGTEFGKDWFDEHGYQNMINARNEQGLMSIGSMLNKVTFEGTNPGGRDMNDIQRLKIWNYLRSYIGGGLRDLGSFSGDTDLQREQFLAIRKELIGFFARKLTARTIIEREGEKAQGIIRTNIKNFPYYADMAEMGIDPYSVFSESYELANAEADYKRWIRGEVAPIGSIASDIPSIKDYVQGSSDALITPGAKSRPKAGPRMKTTSWKPDGSSSQIETWKDADSLFQGGSSIDTESGDD